MANGIVTEGAVANHAAKNPWRDFCSTLECPGGVICHIETSTTGTLAKVPMSVI